MGSNDLLIIGSVIIVGGVILFWKDISAALNLGTDDGFRRRRSFDDDWESEEELCNTTFSKYADYYASRVAEELDKYRDESLKTYTKLEIKGRALLSYKDEFKKMYELNEGCIVPLEGDSRIIFIDVILKLADRMGIKIPSERKSDWKRLIAEEQNRKKPKSVFQVTKIAVM